MTYQGGDIYNVYFDNTMIRLSGVQMVKIAKEVLDSSYLNSKLSLIHKLSERDKEYEKEIISLHGLLNDANESNAKLENMLL